MRIRTTVDAYGRIESSDETCHPGRLLQISSFGDVFVVPVESKLTVTVMSPSYVCRSTTHNSSGNLRVKQSSSRILTGRPNRTDSDLSAQKSKKKILLLISRSIGSERSGEKTNCQFRRSRNVCQASTLTEKGIALRGSFHGASEFGTLDMTRCKDPPQDLHPPHAVSIRSPALVLHKETHDSSRRCGHGHS